MAKTVKGFGIRGQDRKRIRSELTGEYEGLQWLIRFEHAGVFSWNIGKMSGYAGPTVGDVLRSMRKAARAQAKLQEIYGEHVPAEALNNMRLLERWERRILQGRLAISGPHGKGDNRHYRIKEKDSGF